MRGADRRGRSEKWTGLLGVAWSATGCAVDAVAPARTALWIRGGGRVRRIVSSMLPGIDGLEGLQPHSYRRRGVVTLFLMLTARDRSATGSPPRKRRRRLTDQSPSPRRVRGQGLRAMSAGPARAPPPRSRVGDCDSTRQVARAWRGDAEVVSLGARLTRARIPSCGGPGEVLLRFEA